MKTGWPPGLLQDDDRKLSRWFASRPGARYQVRKNLMTDKQPEALRLADALEEKDYPPRRAAAQELRRLHAINAQLLEALCCVRDMVGHPDNLAFIDAAIKAAKEQA